MELTDIRDTKEYQELKRIADKKKAEDELFSPINQQGINGWICPNYGRGMSPYAAACPCVSSPLEITCAFPPGRQTGHPYSNLVWDDTTC